MKPFAELSYSSQVKRLKRLAQSALLKYNLGESRLVVWHMARIRHLKLRASAIAYT